MKEASLLSSDIAEAKIARRGNLTLLTVCTHVDTTGKNLCPALCNPRFSSTIFANSVFLEKIRQSGMWIVELALRRTPAD